MASVKHSPPRVQTISTSSNTNLLGDSESNTELQTPTFDDQETYNINVRKRKHTDDSNETLVRTITQMFTQLKTEQSSVLSKISDDITELKKQNDNIIQSNAEIKKAMSDIVKQQDELKLRVDKLEKTEYKATDSIGLLESELEDVKRRLYESSLEISNLPADDQLTPMELLHKIHLHLDLDFEKRDVKRAFRLKKGKPSRLLVVDFVSTERKQLLTNALRKYNQKHLNNKLNTESLGLDGEKKFIYMNDALTKKGKSLHYHCRQLVKTEKWKYCWTSSGKVFIKKEDDHPAIEVKNEEHLRIITAPTSSNA